MFGMRFVFCFLIVLLVFGCQPQGNEQHADRNDLYQGVKKAMVIVQESYGAYRGIALPFKAYVEAWLRIAGVSVADDDAGSADCIILIAAEGEPLKAKYGARYLYTGARLSGTVQIERPSIHKDEVSFSSVITPPHRFHGSDEVDYGQPENAPFLYSLKGDESQRTDASNTAFDGFKFRLAELMGRYFGRSVLLTALDDYNSKGILRESAVEALAALGKPAVPYLIDAFLFCSPAAEKGVGEALEKITGKKYGSNARRWNEWLIRQERKQQPGRVYENN